MSLQRLIVKEQMRFNHETYMPDIENLAKDFINSNAGMLEPKHCLYSLDFFAANYGVPREKILDGVICMIKYQKKELKDHEG